MDDRLLVGRAIAGDLDSFGQLYDQYFPRVYDFAYRVLLDDDAAGEATRDVFLQAARSLPAFHGSTFGAWLFVMAFRIVLARADRMPAGRLAAPAHEEAFGSFDVPDPSRVSDPVLIDGDHELGAFVWEAATSLSARDRALLDLHLRHGLDSAAIAEVMSINRRDAATLISRMKSAAASAMSAYVVARRGTGDCEPLAGVVAPFDMPPFTDAARRAVDAHIAECAACRAMRDRLQPLLDVFGLFNPVQAPMALKGDVWGAIAAAWTKRPASVADPLASLPGPGEGRAREGIALALGGAGGAGAGRTFAPPTGDGWGRRQVLWFAGAVVGLIAFAFIVGIVAVKATGGGGGGSAVATTRTPTAAPGQSPISTFTPGVAIQTPTPNLTPSATPRPTDTPPPPTPTPAPPSPTPAPPTATPARASATPARGSVTPTVAAGAPTPTPTQAPAPTPTRTPFF